MFKITHSKASLSDFAASANRYFTRLFAGASASFILSPKASYVTGALIGATPLLTSVVKLQARTNLQATVLLMSLLATISLHLMLMAGSCFC